MKSYCGNPGRSGHRLSVKAAEKIYDCREEIAKFFGSSEPTNVVFTLNATYAINIAIKALSKKFSHVLISDLEHNSVLRPVNELKKNGITYDIFNVYPGNDEMTLRSIKAKIKPTTDMIVCTHVSNICNITLPIEKIGKLCKERNLKFIVDMSQSAGSHKININEVCADVLCSPGHKGLFGPQGTGFMIFADKYAKEEYIKKTSAVISGGSGVFSSEVEMPQFLPERFEAGTLPTPSIAGLCEGVKFVRQKTPEEIFSHVSKLCKRTTEMLSSIKNVEVYAKEGGFGQTVLFNVKNISCDNVADYLNQNDICVRSGLHCSPLGHRKLGTLSKGAVRVSFSIFNEPLETERLYKVLRMIPQ